VASARDDDVKLVRHLSLLRMDQPASGDQLSTA
jgi:hypothetical protein